MSVMWIDPIKIGLPAPVSDEWLVTDDGDDGYDDLAVWNGTTTTALAGRGFLGFNLDAGFRFSGVDIPQGKTIESATLTVEVVSVQGSGGDMRIRGVKHDDAPAFNGTGPSDSLTTGTFTDETFDTVQTYVIDVKDIVQQLVLRPGWAEDHIAFVVLRLGGVANNWAEIECREHAGTNEAKLNVTYNDTDFAGGISSLRPSVGADDGMDLSGTWDSAVNPAAGLGLKGIIQDGGAHFDAADGDSLPPQGATIGANTYLRVRINAIGANGPGDVIWHCWDHDDAPAFDGTGPASATPTTANIVSDAMGIGWYTLNFQDLIQELVDRGDFVGEATGSVAVLMLDNGSAELWGSTSGDVENGDNTEMELHIEWTE